MPDLEPGVVAVEFELAELVGTVAVVGEPGAERGGVDELELGVGPRGRGDRLAVGFGAHPGQLVPEPELAQQPLVGVFGEPGQASGQPGLEVEQLTVDLRQGAAVDERRAYVGDAGLVVVGGQPVATQWQRLGGEGA